MLIDDFLPTYDVTERHQISIKASLQQVYAAVRNLDLRGSRLIRWLFLWRGLPALLSSRNKSLRGLGLTFDGLLKSGFILLGETPQHEIALGLVGKFWTAAGCIQRLDAADFMNFTTPGFAKAAWNFSLALLPEGGTKLSTETRVLCLDEASRRRFRFYWLFIRPFSGLIRLEALRAVKQMAENKTNFSSSWQKN
jgi:hypothetical protein